MYSIYAAFVSPEILIVAGVIVLLFGGSQLPKLARSLGQAKQEFESSQKTSTGAKTDGSAASGGTNEPPASV